VRKKPEAQNLFNSKGRSENEIPPAETEDDHENSKPDDVKAVAE
jgi:hypothetical protein